MSSARIERDEGEIANIRVIRTEAVLPLDALPTRDDERWQYLPNRDDYSVSTHGRVARTLRTRGTKPDPLLRGHRLANGSRVIQISDPARPTGVQTIAVHKLVWTTFRGPIPAGKQVGRRDFNPANDRLDNLHLTTRTATLEAKHAARVPGRLKLDAAVLTAIAADTRAAWRIAEEYGVHKNTVDAIREGRYRLPAKTPDARGDNRLLNAAQAQVILDARGQLRAADLAAQYGVSKHTIYAIWQRQAWKHLQPQGDKHD